MATILANIVYRLLYIEGTRKYEKSISKIMMFLERCFQRLWDPPHPINMFRLVCSDEENYSMNGCLITGSVHDDNCSSSHVSRGNRSDIIHLEVGRE